jgi:Tol biopolymer transport system component
MLEVNYLRVSAAIVAVVLAAGLLVKPAEAAFPGSNGKIAFSSNRVTASSPTGDYEIYTMDTGGTGVIQLTDNTADDIQPAWSSDGQQIAFATNRDGGNYEIYMMNAGGTAPTNVSNNAAAVDLDPDWQPVP